MSHFHRFQGRLLPYTNKVTVQKIPTFLHPGSNSSKLYRLVCLLLSMEFTVVVKEVKLMAQDEGIRIYKFPDDGLVRTTPSLSPAYPDLSSSVPGLKLETNHQN